MASSQRLYLPITKKNSKDIRVARLQEECGFYSIDYANGDKKDKLVQKLNNHYKLIKPSQTNLKPIPGLKPQPDPSLLESFQGLGLGAQPPSLPVQPHTPQTERPNQPQDVRDWTNDHVMSWIKHSALHISPEEMEILKQKQIDGRTLRIWSEKSYKMVGISYVSGGRILDAVRDLLAPTSVSPTFLLSTKNATPNARKLLLTKLVAGNNVGPATMSEWWHNNKPSQETPLFPPAALNTPNLYKPEWILPRGASESKVVQPMWNKLIPELNNNTTLKSQPANRYNLDSIGSRRPDVPVYITGKPQTPFYMSAIIDNKGKISGDDFTNEHKGHIASFIDSLLSMTVRNFVIGALNDCRIIKFFKGSRDGKALKILESPTYYLDGDGGCLLSYLFMAEPSELGLITPSILLNKREVVVESQLGCGGCAVVYEGALETEKVVVKLYTSSKLETLANERQILVQLQQLLPYVPRVIGTSDDGHALILSPVAIPFYDIGTSQGFNCQQLRSWHAVHLVELLEKAHKLHKVHRDIKPANFFQHPTQPSKILLNDWSIAVDITNPDTQVPLATTFLFCDSLLLNSAVQHNSTNLTTPFQYIPLPKHDLHSVVKCVYMSTHPFAAEGITTSDILAVVHFWQNRLSTGVWDKMSKAAEDCDYGELKNVISAVL